MGVPVNIVARMLKQAAAERAGCAVGEMTDGPHGPRMYLYPKGQGPASDEAIGHIDFARGAIVWYGDAPARPDG
jgi:hypothetical protein